MTMNDEDESSDVLQEDYAAGEIPDEAVWLGEDLNVQVVIAGKYIVCDAKKVSDHLFQLLEVQDEGKAPPKGLSRAEAGTFVAVHRAYLSEGVSAAKQVYNNRLEEYRNDPRHKPMKLDTMARPDPTLSPASDSQCANNIFAETSHLVHTKSGRIVVIVPQSLAAVKVVTRDCDMDGISWTIGALQAKLQQTYHMPVTKLVSLLHTLGASKKDAIQNKGPPSALMPVTAAFHGPMVPRGPTRASNGTPIHLEFALAAQMFQQNQQQQNQAHQLNMAHAGNVGGLIGSINQLLNKSMEDDQKKDKLREELAKEAKSKQEGDETKLTELVGEVQELKASVEGVAKDISKSEAHLSETATEFQKATNVISKSGAQLNETATEVHKAYQSIKTARKKKILKLNRDDASEASDWSSLPPGYKYGALFPETHAPRRGMPPRQIDTTHDATLTMAELNPSPLTTTEPGFFFAEKADDEKAADDDSSVPVVSWCAEITDSCAGVVDPPRAVRHVKDSQNDLPSSEKASHVPAKGQPSTESVSSNQPHTPRPTGPNEDSWAIKTPINAGTTMGAPEQSIRVNLQQSPGHMIRIIEHQTAFLQQTDPDQMNPAIESLKKAKNLLRDLLNKGDVDLEVIKAQQIVDLLVGDLGDFHGMFGMKIHCVKTLLGSSSYMFGSRASARADDAYFTLLAGAGYDKSLCLELEMMDGEKAGLYVLAGCEFTLKLTASDMMKHALCPLGRDPNKEIKSISSSICGVGKGPGPCSFDPAVLILMCRLPHVKNLIFSRMDFSTEHCLALGGGAYPRLTFLECEIQNLAFLFGSKKLRLYFQVTDPHPLFPLILTALQAGNLEELYVGPPPRTKWENMTERKIMQYLVVFQRLLNKTGDELEWSSTIPEKKCKLALAPFELFGGGEVDQWDLTSAQVRKAVEAAANATPGNEVMEALLSCHSKEYLKKNWQAIFGKRPCPISLDVETEHTEVLPVQQEGNFEEALPGTAEGGANVTLQQPQLQQDEEVLDLQPSGADQPRQPSQLASLQHEQEQDAGEAPVLQNNQEENADGVGVPSPQPQQPQLPLPQVNEGGVQPPEHVVDGVCVPLTDDEVGVPPVDEAGVPPAAPQQQPQLPLPQVNEGAVQPPHVVHGVGVPPAAAEVGVPPADEAGVPPPPPQQPQLPLLQVDEDNVQPPPPQVQAQPQPGELYVHGTTQLRINQRVMFKELNIYGEEEYCWATITKIRSFYIFITFDTNDLPGDKATRRSKKKVLLVIP